MEDEFYCEESRARIRQVGVVMIYQVLMNIIYIIGDFQYLFLGNIFFCIVLFAICFYFRKLHKYIYTMAFIYISYAHTKFLVSDNISKYTLFSNGQIFVLYYTVSPSDFIVQMLAIIFGQVWVTYQLADEWLDALRQTLWTLTFMLFIRVQYIEKKTSYFMQQKQFKVDQIIKNNIFQQILITSFDNRTNLMNVYEKNEQMDQILNGQKNQIKLKQCLETFEIIKASVDAEAKGNLYIYLQKKHFIMQEKSKDKFNKKEMKAKSQQNIPLQKSKNTSFSIINSQKNLKEIPKKEAISQKNVNEQAEYEFLYLMHNEQSFRARIQEVYLDQPLLMIIFENQEIVKNNTKLKKQLEVSNSVLLSFFQEVNSKCNILRSLIFNNDIFNSKFFFQLLQNNIYSIQQYLRKRGINSQRKINSGSASLSFINNNLENSISAFDQIQNQKKQILKFEYSSDNKNIHMAVDISNLFKNNFNKKSKNQIQNNGKNGQAHQSKRGKQQIRHISFDKKYSSFSDEVKLNCDGKHSNTSSTQQANSNSDDIFSISKLDMLEEQNDFDYFSRVKLQDNYNFQNIQKNNISQLKSVQQISNGEQNLQQIPKYFNSDDNKSQQKIKNNNINFIKQFQSKSFNSQKIDQSKLPKVNKIQFENFNQSIKNNKFSNNNSSVMDTNITQNNTFILNVSNNIFINQSTKNSNKNNIDNEVLNVQANENQKGLQIDTVTKFNSNLPSSVNVSNMQLNNQPVSQNFEQKQSQAKETDYNNFKNPMQKIRSSHRHLTQDLLRGNIKYFDFQEILEEIKIFQSQINIKCDKEVAQIKLYSDKDMIVYVLRSFLSSILLINNYRRSQIYQLKFNLQKNLKSPHLNQINPVIQLNNFQQPVFDKNNSNNQANEESLQNDQDLTDSCYSYNLQNIFLEEPAKQTNLRLFFEDKPTNSQTNQNPQNEILKIEQTENRNFQKYLSSKLSKKILFKINNENKSSEKKHSYYQNKDNNFLKNCMKKQDQNSINNQKCDQIIQKNTSNDLYKLNREVQLQDQQNQFDKYVSKTDRRKDILSPQKIQKTGQNIQQKTEIQKYIKETLQEIDIPFDLYESEMEFQLEQSKYCKSINVIIKNINKHELLSCLNLNTNKEVNQTEYEIIKLIIQKIGPQPLFYESRRISFSFLLDLADIMEGYSFFNIHNNDSLTQQNIEKAPEQNNNSQLAQKKESSSFQLNSIKNKV
ncbi:hypothetical protein ABPG72_002915 [Tetrahymena utriculariae]